MDGQCCLRWAVATASLGAALSLLAWCRSGAAAGEHAAAWAPPRARVRGSGANAPRVLQHTRPAWRQVGPGRPTPGSGSGDCTGCRLPIQSHEPGNLTLEHCQEWVEAGCPDVPNLPHGCPNANALGYKVGFKEGEEHMCRAWVCDEEPGWNRDITWECFSMGDASSGNASEEATLTTTLPFSTSTTGSRQGGGNGTATTSSPGQGTTPSPGPSPYPLPPEPLWYCYEDLVNSSYSLDWRSEGRTFFDDWAFHLEDYNNGASEYLNRADATRTKVIEAHDTHAIIRTGQRGARLKRQSVKIASHRTWKYGLIGMRFSHVPWGCGLWPAFWTHAPGYPWPEGGEFDIFEYVNDIPSQTSFHTGARNRCKLAGSMVNKPFCPVMPDMNGMDYDCTTKYPLQLGCAVNRAPLMNGQDWANFPSVILVEWTERFLKVFVIPEQAIPEDLHADKPKPNTWDRWLVSYYPFAQSNELYNDTCPSPGDVMQPQQLVLQINFCGDWAGKVWHMSSSCVNHVGPTFPHQCMAVDPLLDRRPGAMEQDCCTQFIWDGNQTYGTDEYLAQRAFFNISWVKVWKSPTT